MIRLAGVGAVVFLANAGLLVLQLVAGRLLAPYIGSSLQTWTSIIAAFLVGIALGNYLGGSMADRSPRPSRLALYLLMGVFATIWMTVFPSLLDQSGMHKYIGLGVRIPVLCFILCLPVAFVLSLITPLAIKIGVPDIGKSGLISGVIFSLSTIGCLLGNYLTGFYLIPAFTINTIVYTVAGLLGATMLGTIVVSGLSGVAANGGSTTTETTSTESAVKNETPMLIGYGFAIVFLCSFGAMTLELAASRLLAQVVGVSIYTWTGIIGVMLAGTALGNLTGGIIADKAAKKGRINSTVLIGSLLVAAAVSGLVLIFFSLMTRSEGIRETIEHKHIMWRVIVYTFSLFFLPMFALGTISPQVIRLCVRDVATAGQTAGRIYAVSTVGAILGTFMTGYVLISTLGVNVTILLTLLLPCLATLCVFADSTTKNLNLANTNPFMAMAKIIAESSFILYTLSVLAGILVGGIFIGLRSNTQIAAETNYYTIRSDELRNVQPPTETLAAVVGFAAVDDNVQFEQYFVTLYLDHLVHSKVDLKDPKYLYYEHEIIQTEFVRRAVANNPEKQNVLVIGGGGYTLPRYVRTAMPSANVDVVEIDPGVTRFAEREMGLIPAWKIKTYNMDGRQYVSEISPEKHYDVITLDAVNDYSVPWHLLTKECNEAVKKTLTPDGVYLVTVIDLARSGELWKATYQTLKQSFRHVELLYTTDNWTLIQELVDNGDTQENRFTKRNDRAVIVLYASDVPIEIEKLRETVAKQTEKPSGTVAVPKNYLDTLLTWDNAKPIVLTDQYAPVDTMMKRVFQTR